MTFTITPEQYAALKASLSTTKGVSLTDNGNSGTVVSSGVTLGCAYDGEVTLTVLVEHKPFIDPESMVEAHIKTLFNSFING